MIGGSDFTARPVLADYDAGTINSALYAVTVEQAGGSPDGKPHSAPIFTGKLIETVPAGCVGLVRPHVVLVPNWLRRVSFSDLLAVRTWMRMSPMRAKVTSRRGRRTAPLNLGL